MKQVVVVVALVVLFLTACEMHISVRPGVTVGGFQTEYEYNGRSVVCDDRTTAFTYVLSYPSSLESFDIYLEGSSSGRVRHIHSVRLNDRDRAEGRYERSFSVGQQIVPLADQLAALSSVDREVQIQGETVSDSRAIVVNPREPEIIGYTTLVVEADRRLTSGGIPVLDFCG